MEQYISKSALVAEIERLRKNQRLDDRHGQGVLDGLHAIERFIDTLEVKEAKEERVSEDLEKVAELYTLDDSIKPWRNLTKEAFKDGAKWQKEHLWKPADGDDLKDETNDM